MLGWCATQNWWWTRPYSRWIGDAIFAMHGPSNYKFLSTKMLNEKLAKKQIMIGVKGAAQNIFIQQRKPSTQCCQVRQHNFKITRGRFLNPRDPILLWSAVCFWWFTSRKLIISIKIQEPHPSDSGITCEWFRNHLGSDSGITWGWFLNHPQVIQESLESDSGIPSKWFRNHSQMIQESLKWFRNHLSDSGITWEWSQVIQESLLSDSGTLVNSS